MWYLSFWDLVNSLNMIISGCIHFPANSIISLFLWLNKFHCVNKWYLSMNFWDGSIVQLLYTGQSSKHCCKVSVRCIDLQFWESGIVGSYCRFQKNLNVDFYDGGLGSLHYSQLYARVFLLILFSWWQFQLWYQEMHSSS